jgi:hypothetical protein
MSAVFCVVLFRREAAFLKAGPHQRCIMYGMSNRLNATENCCTVEDNQRKKDVKKGE